MEARGQGRTGGRGGAVPRGLRAHRLHGDLALDRSGYGADPRPPHEPGPSRGPPDRHERAPPRLPRRREGPLVSPIRLFEPGEAANVAAAQAARPARPESRPVVSIPHVDGAY